jgi:hypothetical protein
MSEQVKAPKQPPTDPLIKTMRKIYGASATARVEKLLDAERFWRRRATIAANKLGEIQDDIRTEIRALATESDGKGVKL